MRHAQIVTVHLLYCMQITARCYVCTSKPHCTRSPCAGYVRTCTGKPENLVIVALPIRRNDASGHPATIIGSRLYRILATYTCPI
jgi:hypothetical protein